MFAISILAGVEEEEEAVLAEGISILSELIGFGD